jgi:hypothetical protein
MSIYEKMMIHFQHFYNDHDSLSLSALLFFPLCQTHIKRTTMFWNPTTWNAERNPFFTDRQDLTLLHSVTHHGKEILANLCEHIFEKLPDSLIVLHDLTIKELKTNDSEREGEEEGEEEEEGGGGGEGVILYVPYDYLFKVPFKVKHITTPSSSSTTTTANTFNVGTGCDMVDVELKGCLEVRFSADNSIYEIYDHNSIVCAHHTTTTTTTTDASVVSSIGNTSSSSSQVLASLARYMGYRL